MCLFLSITLHDSTFHERLSHLITKRNEIKFIYRINVALITYTHTQHTPSYQCDSRLKAKCYDNHAGINQSCRGSVFLQILQMRWSRCAQKECLNEGKTGWRASLIFKAPLTDKTATKRFARRKESPIPGQAGFVDKIITHDYAFNKLNSSNRLSVIPATQLYQTMQMLLTLKIESAHAHYFRILVGLIRNEDMYMHKNIYKI